MTAAIAGIIAGEKSAIGMISGKTPAVRTFPCPAKTRTAAQHEAA